MDAGVCSRHEVKTKLVSKVEGQVHVKECYGVWYAMVHVHVWYVMLCYGMLWYAMVCYGMLWYAMVCYGMLTMLCYGMVCIVWYGTYEIKLEL